MSSILTVEGVNKNFSGLKALDDVNLVVEEGSVHAIIGPNGAGKSTFLNCLVGRLVPDTGTVLYYGNKPEGETLFGLPPHAINQKGISRVFQTPEVFEDLTLFENAMIPVMAHLDGSYRFNSWVVFCHVVKFPTRQNISCPMLVCWKNVTCIPVLYRAVTNVVWNWPCVWHKIPNYYCWMNRPLVWHAPTPTTPSIF